MASKWPLKKFVLYRQRVERRQERVHENEEPVVPPIYTPFNTGYLAFLL